MMKNKDEKILQQLLVFLIFEWLHHFLYKKLELIAMNKLGIVWFYGTFLINFYGYSLKNVKSLK